MDGSSFRVVCGGRQIFNVNYYLNNFCAEEGILAAQKEVLAFDPEN